MLRVYMPCSMPGPSIGPRHGPVGPRGPVARGRRHDRATTQRRKPQVAQASLAAGPDLQDRVEPACFSKAFVRAGLVAVTLVGLVTRSRWATAQPPDGRPFQGQGPTLLASHPRRSGAAEGGGRWSAPSPGAASAAATPGLCSATALVGLGGSLTMSSQRPATLPVPRQTGTISLATLAVMAMMGVPLISLLRAQGLVGQRWSAPQPRVYAAPDAARDAQAQAGEEGPLASGAESGESVVNEPAVSAALAAGLGAATSQPSPAAAEVAPLQTGVENPLGPKVPRPVPKSPEPWVRRFFQQSAAKAAAPGGNRGPLPTSRSEGSATALAAASSVTIAEPTRGQSAREDSAASADPLAGTSSAASALAEAPAPTNTPTPSGQVPAGARVESPARDVYRGTKPSNDAEPEVRPGRGIERQSAKPPRRRAAGASWDAVALALAPLMPLVESMASLGLELQEDRSRRRRARPSRSPAAAALLQEWGPTQPSAYDPLHGLADWSAPTVWSKYDPLVRAIRSTARPGSSKYDPLDARSRAPRSQPAFFAASAAGPDKYDAVGCMLAAAAASFGGRATSTQGPQRYDAAGQLLRASLQHTLPEARSVRYDPIDWLRSGWAGGPEVPAAPRGAARYDPVSGLGSVTAPRHATKYDPARELLSGDWLDAATRGFDAAASRLGLIPEAATNEGRASMEGPAEDLDGVARDAADPSIWSPKTPALSSL
ncbi:hypothetical protein ACKKBF_B16165 [Auxenochlorella protothecoides x Auxenochlorella symbiontica]